MKGSKLKWVIVLGIALRVVLWVLQVEPAGDDGMRYLTEAVNLVDHGVFSTDRNVQIGAIPSPDAHDLPLWPTTMAIFYKVSHSVRFTQYAAVAFNVFLMCLTVTLFCSILRSNPFYVGEKGLTFGCSVLLFMPDSILYSLYHMPDMMAVFFVTSGMWSYFKFVSTCRYMYVLLYSLSFGLAILSKPICIPLFGFLSFTLLFVTKTPFVKRVMCVLISFSFVAVMLIPWAARNQKAFGIVGLTTISGTNLYGCNWGRLVDTFPASDREKYKAEMETVERRLQGKDKMSRSKALGEYARKQILAHFPQYIKFSLVRHPRLYMGTGTVALLRYLGLNAECYALDDFLGSGNHAPNEPRVPYTRKHTVIGCCIQIISWFVLFVGYLLVAIGMMNAVRKMIRGNTPQERVLMLCPILCILLLAVVIGPITATRYRFIMIPYFSMLAAFSVLESVDTKKKNM